MSRSFISQWADAAYPLIVDKDRPVSRKYSRRIVSNFINSMLNGGKVRGGHNIDDSNLSEHTDAIVEALESDIASNSAVISFFARSFRETLPDIVSKTQPSPIQKRQYLSVRALG